MDKLFWADSLKEKTYQDLISDLCKIECSITHIWFKDTYEVLLRIIHSLVFDYPIVLYDGDFTEEELVNYGYLEISENINKNEFLKKFKSFEMLAEFIGNAKKWNITLLTSGTTGIPKKVTHNAKSITKACKLDKKHKNDIWGYAYNPTHMAGIQVFFQAFMNLNTMINLFKEAPQYIHESIDRYNITHISATPTFYRLILKDNLKYPKIIQISSGGEKLTENLALRLKNSFPNAKIKNIYASTEAGSLFASEGEYFKIPSRFKDKIKVINNELILHKSLLGHFQSLILKNDWYYTGDIIEFINRDKNLFRIIARKNKMINIGGYKVNPEEVEEALLENEKIYQVRVYGKSNPVLGNILCADIVSEKLTENEIRKSLDIQEFKKPRIITFKDEIDTTRTGKVKR